MRYTWAKLYKSFQRLGYPYFCSPRRRSWLKAAKIGCSANAEHRFRRPWLWRGNGDFRRSHFGAYSNRHISTVEHRLSLYIGWLKFRISEN